MLGPQIQDEYFGVFPTVLFKCPNFTDSMHFIMALKDFALEEEKDLVTLMLHCGASISFDLLEATDHSILIVNHEDIIPFPGPAFTLNYIKDCLDALRLLDISQYRQEATSHIASEVDVMSVVYFQTEKWEDYVGDVDIKWISLHFKDNQTLEDPFKDASGISLHSKDNQTLEDPFQDASGIISSTAIEEESDFMSDEELNPDSSKTDIEKSTDNVNTNNELNTVVAENIDKECIEENQNQKDCNVSSSHDNYINNPTLSEYLNSSAESKTQCLTIKGRQIKDASGDTIATDSDIEEFYKDFWPPNINKKTQITHTLVDIAAHVKKGKCTTTVTKVRSSSKGMKSNAEAKTHCQTKKGKRIEDDSSDTTSSNSSDEETLKSMNANKKVSSSTNTKDPQIKHTPFDLAAHVDKEKCTTKVTKINKAKACSTGEQVGSPSKCMKSNAEAKTHRQTKKGKRIENDSSDTTSSNSSDEETSKSMNANKKVSSSTNTKDPQIKHTPFDLAAHVDKEKCTTKVTKINKAEACSTGEQVRSPSKCVKSSAEDKKSGQTKKGRLIEDDSSDTTSSNSSDEETLMSMNANIKISSSTNTKETQIKHTTDDIAAFVEKEKCATKITNINEAEACSTSVRSPTKCMKSSAEDKKNCQTRKGRQIEDNSRETISSNSSDEETLKSMNTKKKDSACTHTRETQMKHINVDLAAHVDKEKCAEACSTGRRVISPTKWDFFDDFDSSDEDKDVCPKPIREDIVEDISTEKGEKVCQSKNNRDFLQDFEFASDADERSKSNKRSRHPYSQEERINILNYIVDHNEFTRVKGRELWIIMERKKVCPSRTWQSMKEHFLKKVVTDLEPYPFISNEAKRKLRLNCF